MKKLLLISGLMILLLFGCLGIGGTQQTTKSNTSSNIIPSIPSIPSVPNVLPTQKDCSPSYNFAEPLPGTLSKKSTISGTVTCAENKTITLNLDGIQVAEAIPSTDASTPVSFDVYPNKEGNLALTVLSNSETIFSRNFTVSPLGITSTKGNDYDSVSFKEWRTMAIDVDSPVSISRVKILMKRYDVNTLPNERIEVDIRSNDGGKPSSTAIGSAFRSINATALNENWLSFDFNTPVTLQSGRYWVVVFIPQDPDIVLVSDAIGIHTVVNDKQADGNSYTRFMRLNVDGQGIASTTSWNPLEYDRSYSIALYTQKIGK